ncbi:MAG TPA: M28 family metallopeptidase [Gryllotalpicola sp.]
MTTEAADQAYADLTELVTNGTRFHGSPTMAAASRWLERQLEEAGLSAVRQRVELPGWTPGTARRVTVTAPHRRELPAWPMLWSGGSGGRRTGTVEAIGPEGIWGDSIVWQRFLVTGEDGIPIAYLHARDRGPAAPQPLPVGSDRSLAHLVIGHLDGLQLAEWLSDGKRVTIEIDADAGPVDEPAVSDNLIVDIEGAAEGKVVTLCAHYDTFFNTVGAYDNGSGTVALLELARFWALTPPPVPVRLVFFTAEEWHLLGSRHYVASAAEGELDRIAYLLNLDGLGRGSFMEAFASPEPFEADIRRAILGYARESGRELELASRFPPTKGTDDASFWAVGVPSAFITFNDLHRLHQPDDEPNRGIAANIVWTIELTKRIVAAVSAPERGPAPGLL